MQLFPSTQLLDPRSFPENDFSTARYIPRERFLAPQAPPSINFVHGSYRKCLNLT